jgi:hypothetical protein
VVSLVGEEQFESAAVFMSISMSSLNIHAVVRELNVNFDCFCHAGGFYMQGLMSDKSAARSKWQSRVEASETFFATSVATKNNDCHHTTPVPLTTLSLFYIQQTIANLDIAIS